MKLIAATAMAVLFACQAWAAPNCAKAEDVVDILSGRYGEEVIALGVDARGNLVTWWGNVETGSWTIVVSDGDRSCIVGQGGGFQRTALAPNL